MPSRTSSAADVLARLAEMVGLGEEESGLAGVLDGLQRQTRAQLLEWGRCLGLADIGRLDTTTLVRRVREALAAVGVAGAPSAADAPPADEPAAELPADRAHRFDLGRPAGRDVAAEHIPWSYGQDRVTAMVVDPDRLFVYWEVTDDAIARARAGLGAGGAEAWLALRIYDVTGRLFDGTNAHSYEDHKIARTDRQWFLGIDKPTSSAIVEIGLKSFEGYFVKIARSGRVEFPRKEPAPPGGVEWLTVHAATGDLPPPSPGDDGGHAARFDVAGAWPLAHPRTDDERAHGVAVEAVGGPIEQLVQTWRDEGRTVVWEGPPIRTTWEAGPFDVLPDLSETVEEHHDGTTRVHVQNGRTRVVYGPWKVVIRGLGAHAERRVVATWEVQRTWGTTEHVERDEPRDVVALGGSERRAPGASERRFVAASELRLGGASEVWRLGATELRFLGASERSWGGASWGGASERWLRGASERRLGGASEQLVAEPATGDGGDAPLPYPDPGHAVRKA